MSETKSLELPKFSGKDDDFHVYWTKFKAFATAKQVMQALVGKEPDLPNTEKEVLDLSLAADVKKNKARIRNNIAVAYLLSSFKAQADICLVYETQDEDWPGGLAYKVVQKLMEIYMPIDTVTDIELETKLMAVTMKPKDDPKVLFEQIATIQNWYNRGSHKIPIARLIATTLRAAPEAYSSVLTSEQQSKKDMLELSHLRVVMVKFYRQTYKLKRGKQGDGDELQLLATDADKYKRNKNDGGKEKRSKFKGTCNYCGKTGHKAADCWDNPANASKVPKWYKPKTRNGDNEVTASQISELQLCQIIVGNEECDLDPELQLVNMNWGRYAEAFEEDESETMATELREQEIIEATETATEKKEENYVEEKTMFPNTELMLRMATTPTYKNSLKMLEDPEVWVVDTGATTHSTGHN